MNNEQEQVWIEEFENFIAKISGDIGVVRYCQESMPTELMCYLQARKTAQSELDLFVSQTTCCMKEKNLENKKLKELIKSYEQATSGLVDYMRLKELKEQANRLTTEDGGAK